MDAIRPLTSTPPVTPAPTVAPVRSVAPTDGAGAESRLLEPAVSLDLRPEAGEAKPDEPERRAYVRDAQSQSLVFRVTDPKTGDVVMQIPDEVVLKARIYAKETTSVFTGERVARTV